MAVYINENLQGFKQTGKRVYRFSLKLSPCNEIPAQFQLKDEKCEMKFRRRFLFLHFLMIFLLRKMLKNIFRISVLEPDKSAVCVETSSHCTYLQITFYER